MKNRSTILGLAALFLLAATASWFFPVLPAAKRAAPSSAEHRPGNTPKPTNRPGPVISSGELLGSFDDIVSASTTGGPLDRLPRGRGILDLAEKAAPADLAALFERARKDGNDARIVAKRWAETDPAAFFAWLEENPEGDPWNFNAYKTLFHVWARSDPQAALDAARSAKHGKKPAVTAVFVSLMNTDPEAGLQLLAANPNTHIPWNDFKWAEKNAAYLAPRLADFEVEHWFVRHAMETAFVEWFREDPEAAFDWAQTLPKNKTPVQPALVEQLAAHDPASAAAYVADTLTGDDLRRASRSVAAEWAKSDPAAALGWVTDNLWGNARRDGIDRVIATAAQSQPETALGLLEAMPPTAARSKGYATLARTWIKADRDAALAWVDSIPDPAHRTNLYHELAHGWKQGSFKQAGHWLAREAADPDAVPTGFTDIIGRKWASHFPGESVHWVRQLPPGHVGAGAYAVFDTWSAKNPAAVIPHVAELGPGEIRQQAHAALAENFYSRDPAAAAQWIASLDPEDQNAALSRLSESKREAIRLGR